MTYKLLHFTNEELGNEFVVILAPGSDEQEFYEAGYELESSLDIEGDAGMYPCDRPLT